MASSKVKKFKKAIKVLPESVISELELMGEQDLRKVCADAAAAIDQAVEERDELPAYKEAKERLKDLSLALKDTKTYQGAKITFALARLKELSGEDLGELGDLLVAARSKTKIGSKKSKKQ